MTKATAQLECPWQGLVSMVDINANLKVSEHDDVDEVFAAISDRLLTETLPEGWGLLASCTYDYTYIFEVLGTPTNEDGWKVRSLIAKLAVEVAGQLTGVSVGDRLVWEEDGQRHGHTYQVTSLTGQGGHVVVNFTRILNDGNLSRDQRHKVTRYLQCVQVEKLIKGA